MSLTIPPEGLDEARSVWSGRGSLWGAVGAVHDDAGMTWSPAMVRRRAARVVVEQLRGHLRAWPATKRGWIDALPAETLRRRQVSDAPSAGVDWVRTRLSGWPPREFHLRQRARVADTVLLKATRWTIESLTEVVAQVDQLDRALIDADRDYVDTARSAMALEPLASARPERPTRGDLVAMRSSGRPWTSVAAVAHWLRIMDSDPEELAVAALDPDPALADRLFHVAVLGVVVRRLREAGCQLHVVGLPGSPQAKPILKVRVDGDDWDLWFEMAGAWSYYGVPSPYGPAANGIVGTGASLGADIGLVRLGEAVIVLECKYSVDPTYVGRAGYEQTLAYMAEALTGLADRAAGVVVGPSEVVTSTGVTDTSVGRVSITNPSGLGAVLVEALGAGAGSLVA